VQNYTIVGLIGESAGAICEPITSSKLNSELHLKSYYADVREDSAAE
jgi:hypothetical protein